MGDRPTDHTFLSPDTIIPQPANPQSFNRYAYAVGNPLKYRDPSGHWIETAWDIANIGWDIYEVSQDPSLLNIGCLVVDVAAAALPFVPGGAGLLARGGKAAEVVVTHGDEIAEVVAHADELGDAARILEEGLEQGGKEAVEQAGKEAAGLSFRKFTKSNFRENLRRLTGKAKEGIKGLEAHHILPQKFAKQFEKIGINVHDPKFGTWVDQAAHRGWSAEYNRQWELFFQKFGAPTEQQALDFAQQLAERYGFDVNFAVP